jgi:hypothetical protein
MRKHSIKPLPKLKKKAEKIFHRYIVLRDRNVCFTCLKVGNQAGHFRHNKLDFDEMNLNCQCPYCNLFIHGNLGIYAVKLIEKYGKDKVDDLVFRSNTQSNKFSRAELEEIIAKYTSKIQDMFSDCEF